MDDIESGSPVTMSEKHLEFTGNAREYFSIWIVNLLLTVLTLGVYSAWAKVRTTQYFYGNTHLDGHSFRYLAKPLQILKGRAIAVALLLAYYASGLISPMATGISALILVLLLPAFVVMSMSFQLHNSAYRNIRFGFQKNFSGIYKIAVIPLLILLPYFLILATTSNQELAAAESQDSYKGFILALSPLVFMLTYPFWEFLLVRFKVTHAAFGAQALAFTAPGKEFYKIYLKVFVAFLFFGVLIAVFVGMLGSFAGADDSQTGNAPSAFMFLILIPVAALYMWAFAYVHTRKTNLVYSNLLVGDQQLASRLEVKTVFILYVTNTLAIAASLGLMMPWAKVRTVRYRVQQTSLLPGGDLDSFVSAQRENQSAMGEGVGDIFDMDLGM